MVTRALVVALLAACGACAAEPELPVLPYVEVLSWVEPDAPVPVEWSQGAQLWADVGFRVERAPEGTPRCPNRWYDGLDTECVIQVGVTVEPCRERYNVNGYASTNGDRRVFVDDDLTGLDLLRVVGHEVGHVIANLDHHQGRGLMSNTYSIARITDDDLDLVCNTIGVCL